MSKVIFFLVQHVKDLLRKEPRNVGVIVTDGERLVARFLGETVPGTLDLRRVSPEIVPDRALYAEWHQEWRRQLVEQDVAVERMIAESSPAFWILYGGEWYMETMSDPINLERLTDEIYRRVVSLDALTWTK